MFILDSLMIAGIRWALETALTAAEAEMNDDSVLREQLLEAEMRREMGEISDEEFQEMEADLLARIREIKQRREGGSGPLAFGGAQPMETTDGSTFQVEASVSGDFYDPGSAPHTTVLEQLDPHKAVGGLIGTRGDETIEVLDMDAGDAAAPAAVAAPTRHRGSASRNPPHKRKRSVPATGKTSRQADAVGRVPRSGPGGAHRKRTVGSRRTKP
jgi:hypothetical protein